MSDRCQRICLTPTRNEAWVIKKFLSAARHWADQVIVADQGSTDGTLEELRSTEKVQVVINDSPVYDEAHRQRLLISKARQIEGKRVFFALDADEALSANATRSREWDLIARASPGTLLRFQWVNILPGFEKAWIPPTPITCGFVDDGSDHSGEKIHSTRVPQPKNAPVLDLKEIVVLHFQYVAWDRVVRKHRWYQAWEHVTHPDKGPLQIFREYNHMYGSWSPSEIQTVRPEWLSGYEQAGLDYRTLKSEPVTWWDREIVSMLREHGTTHFRKIALWDAEWNAIAKTLGHADRDLSDPRSVTEKLAHRLLRATQPYRSNLGVRCLERLLRVSGW